MMYKYDFKGIHIGSLIKKLIEIRSIDEDRISNFFKDHFIDLEKIFDSESLDSNELLKWSKLLEYDLFRIYSQHILLYSKVKNIDQISTNVKDIPTFRKHIYTKEIIYFIIELLNTNKMTVKQVIDTYSIPKTTLYKWINKYSNNDSKL